MNPPPIPANDPHSPAIDPMANDFIVVDVVVVILVVASQDKVGGVVGVGDFSEEEGDRPVVCPRLPTNRRPIVVLAAPPP